jgi:hypothetical protein
MALLVVALLGMLGLAIDGARLYIARAELSRAVDAAALAGVAELPDTDDAQAAAEAYLTENAPGASATFPTTTEEFQVRIQGTRTVDMFFMGLFGINDVDVGVTAAAGFGQTPVDTVLTIDATSSMASPCNSSQSNSGCPIKEAKDAATAFAGTLLNGAGTRQAAVVPYRGCYKPPRQYDSCVPAGWLHDLSSSYGLVSAKINDIGAQGGSGTNVCLGLYQTEEVLFGPQSQTSDSALHIAVLLSDGDNNYNSVAFGNGEPPTDCRPSSPNGSDGTSGCSNSASRERQLDTKTLAIADALKAQGAEVYVVGFGVCGSAGTSQCNRAMVGGTHHDDIADRNLLKCIASSSASTNDHYFEVPTASDLPAVFAQIAQSLAFRLVE